MNLAQIVQSHRPELLPPQRAGPPARPGQRAIGPQSVWADRGGARAGTWRHPAAAFGQQIIELLGGRKIHPAWAVPGGVRRGLAEQGRAHIREALPEARATALDALGRFKRLLEQL